MVPKLAKIMSIKLSQNMNCFNLPSKKTIIKTITYNNIGKYSASVNGL